jgi:hypothetical protein
VTNDVDANSLANPLFMGTVATSGSATIEAAGAQTEPLTTCSRYLGGVRTLEWFLDVRAADNRLWTIRGGGMPSPVVSVGDTVTFDFNATVVVGDPPSLAFSTGSLNLATSAGGSLLWGYAGAPAGQIAGFDLNAGNPVCGGGCVAASISSVLVSSELTGDKVEIPPYGSADIDGFRVDVGAVVVTSPLPGCSFGGPLDAAGVRLP